VVDAISWALRQRVGLQPIAVTMAAVLLVSEPALRSFKFGYRLSLPDTRLLAKAWVEKNIPPDSKIVMDSGKYYLEVYGPPLPLSRWSLEQFINRGKVPTLENIARREGTRRIAYSGESAYFRYQLDVLRDRAGYDIVQVLHDIGSTKSDVLTLNQYV